MSDTDPRLWSIEAWMRRVDLVSENDAHREEVAQRVADELDE